MLLLSDKGYFHIEIPDAFFQDLQNLKVLHISNLQITSFPSSIGFLNELNILCLDGVAVEDIKVVGKLKTLQILILGSITRIPREIGELNGLRLLNLEECSELEVIEPNVLGRLIHLEELILPLHFDQWDAKGIRNASLNELNNMSYLSNLVICVRDVTSLAIIMPVQQLVQYDIYTGWAWKWTDRGESRSLKLEFDSSSSELIWKECLQTVLKKTQDLYLEGWIGNQDAITKLSKKGFPELKHIHIESCPSIQYITHSEQSNPFPVLETLSLRDLINLQEIWKGGLPFSSLCNLKVIKIIACKELRNLFSFTLVKVLPLLQEIEVSDCPMIREIVTFDEVESINCGERDRGKVELLELKCLQRLKLENLQNFSSFCSKGTSEIAEDGRLVSLPCLKSLTLCKLPKLRKISDIHYKVKLGSLKSLELRGCPSLSYALDSNLMQQIRTLESLVIEDCKSMETVFNVEITETDVHEEMLKTHEVISNQYLRTNLKLSKLPRLKKLWNNDLEKIPFLVLLTKLEVSNCDELENLFSASTVKTLSKVSHISIASCKKMKEILSKEESEDQKIEFQSLSYLSVSNMENLTMFSHGNRRCQFPSLMQLIITDCPKMKEFVSMKDGKEEISSEDATEGEPFFNKKVDVPSLEKLVLRSLGSLISIWDDNNLSDAGSFKKLESVEIKECERIQLVFGSHLVKRLEKLTKVKIEGCESLEVLWEIVVNEATGVPSLRDINVKNCCKLVTLFPNAIARTLSKLQNMYISSCELLKEVVTDDGDMDKTEKMEFCNLSALQLEDLGSLVHFYSGHYELCFPFLKKLSIINCKNLKEFALRSSNLVESEEQSQEISSTNNMEVGFSSLFNEKVVFPDLEGLQIKGLQVKEIWSKKEPAGSLMKLKKLEVEKCHQLSLIIPSFLLHNFCNLELLSVKSCNSMEVIFELEKYRSRRPKISRSKSTENILDRLRKLTVSSCKSVHHIVAIKGYGCIGDTSYKTILPQLTSLKLTNLPSLGTFCTENYEIGLPSIVKMVVEDCKTMTLLVADNMDLKPLLFVEKVKFPLLESMEITDMQNLEELWHITQSECSSKAFCKLEGLQVHGCKSLSTLFPLKMIRGFQNLKELSVIQCESLERVFESPMITSGAESNSFNDVVILPRLEKLVLCSLKKMISIWDDNNLSNGSFDKLASVEIRECAKIELIFHSHIMKRLQNLIEIHVADCESLKVLMKRHSSQEPVLSFSSFSSMRISSCKRLKEIVSIDCEEEDKALTKVLRFNNLSFLELENLDSLIHFCSRHYELYFPLLEKLWIVDCMNLRSFIPRPSNSAGPKEQSQQISLTSNLDATNPPLFDHKVLFPNLGKLRIKGLDEKEIWPREEPESFLINLKEFEVERCNQLSMIIPPRMLPNLHNLESLSVKSCNSVEHIVVVRDGNYNGEKYYKTVIFPQLSSVELSDLPKLGSFGNKNHRIGLPSLSSLEINRCEAVEVLVADSNQDCTPLLLVEKVEFPLLESVEIIYMQNLKELWHISNEATHSECSSKAFCKLERLEVDKCWSLSTVFPSKMIRGFQNLKQLFVEECKSLESVFESPVLRSGVESNSFNDVVILPRLEKLVLRSLERMISIWPDNNLSNGSFEELSTSIEIEECAKIKPNYHPKNLKELVVEGCNRLLIVIPPDMLPNLHSLESLSVKSCNSVKVIFNLEKYGSGRQNILEHLSELTVSSCESVQHIVATRDNNHIGETNCEAIIFSQLSFIKLFELPELGSFGDKNHMIGLPSLSRLEISECKAVEVLVADSNEDYTPLLLVEEVPIHSECSSKAVCNLEELKVKSCDTLRHAFPASVAKCLRQLNKLEVVDCKIMEGIVFWKEEIANPPFISTPSPDQSTNFSVGTHSMELEWPSLKTLVFTKCPKAKIFASGQQKVNIPRLEELTVYEGTLESQQFINELNANPTSLVLYSIENEAWSESTSWSFLHQKFPNLRNLRIRCCDSKEIFPSDYEKEGDMAVVSYKSGVPGIFDTLEIEKCHHLTMLLPSPALFRNLAILKVFSCNGLRYLVTSSAAKGLVHLTELEILGCDKLEEIVTYDCSESGNRAKDDDGGDMISFPHLKKLKLKFLGELQSFSSTSYKFNFPSLTNVFIHKVRKMHVFCEGDFSAPNKHKITTGIRDLFKERIISLRMEDGKQFSI